MEEGLQELYEKLHAVERHVSSLARQTLSPRRDRRTMGSLVHNKCWAEFLPTGACPVMFIISDFPRDRGGVGGTNPEGFGFFRVRGHVWERVQLL